MINKRDQIYGNRLEEMRRNLDLLLLRMNTTLAAWAQDQKASPTGRRIAQGSLEGVLTSERHRYTQTN